MGTNDLVLTSPEPAPLVQPEESLVQWALRNGANADTLAKLIDQEFRIKAEAARLAWIDDMARLKADIPEILKTKHKQGGIRNGKEQADYWYAELDKACPILIAALTRYNFTHRWETAKSEPNWIEVACVIQHKQGHSERTVLGGPPDNTGGKNAIQAVGSTKYYLERYTLFAALGIAPKGQDSDGVAPGIPTGLREERCGEIQTANSLEQLRARYQLAYKEAREQKDNDATLLYTEAYEQRKEQLMGDGQ